MEKEMKTLSEMMQKFRDKQFIHDFEIKNNLLICKETNESFNAEAVHQIIISYDLY